MNERLLAILFASRFTNIEAVLAKRDRAPSDLQSEAVPSAHFRLFDHRTLDFRRRLLYLNSDGFSPGLAAARMSSWPLAVL